MLNVIAAVRLLPSRKFVQRLISFRPEATEAIFVATVRLLSWLHIASMLHKIRSRS
jgi:hypothetical protein